MLTYFEVGPNACFPEHRHINEQITLVLEGELSFCVDGDTIVVREGEVVAIPGDLPHSACTASRRVRAVDAWSPPIEEHITAP
jgi:quercetin dioxygenase-like cupin family protein